MKQLFIVVLIIIGIASPFLFSFFLGNYTATAIGIVLIGAAVTVLLADMGAGPKTYIYLWIGIIVILVVLLGLQQYLPKPIFSVGG